MRRPASLTGRLILTLTLGATVLWTLAAAATVLILQRQLDEAFDGGLRETAERLLPLAADGLGDQDEDHDGHEIPMLRESHDEYITYQLRTADGSILLRSHDSPATGFAAPLIHGFATVEDTRIYSEGRPEGDIFIQVAESLSHRRQSLFESAVILFLPLLGLVPLAALGIWLAVRSGLRPLRTLSGEIARRHAGNLEPIRTSGLLLELAPIGTSIQNLITRLHGALDAERSFAANSAHELRTPIAGGLAQTQRLIVELRGHPAQDRARQIETTLKRLKDVAEKLLQLSRADAGIAATGAVLDLLPAVKLVVGDCRQHAASSERLRLNIAPGGQFGGAIDIDAFGIALRNLIDNALAHGAPDEPVNVNVIDAHTVSVVNGGPVVPPETLATLKVRFVRGPTLAHGSGLGLAIVDAIVSQVGGRLELESPARGRADGFEARLVLA